VHLECSYVHVFATQACAQHTTQHSTAQHTHTHTHTRNPVRQTQPFYLFIQLLLSFLTLLTGFSTLSGDNLFTKRTTTDWRKLPASDRPGDIGAQGGQTHEHRFHCPLGLHADIQATKQTGGRDKEGDYKEYYPI
jgi:hypothetical protein